MFKFDAGAMRPSGPAMRADQLEAANDLVRRTLAQHGLMPAASEPQGGETPMSAPGLADMLSGLTRGADTGVPIPQGAEFRQDRFACDAGSRNYRLYVPASAAQGVRGLVVMLHGCTQTPEDFARATGMNNLAETERFVVLYPEQSRGDNAQSCWNWFSRGDQRRDRGEPAILAGLARRVAQDHQVPKARIFVAGLSAGAAMAVILGQAYGDVFAAVGAHSGLPFGVAHDVPSAFAAMAGRGADAAQVHATGPATRTIIFHGSADSTVHPMNGAGIARDALSRGAGQTVQICTDGEVGGRAFTRTVSTAPCGRTQVEEWVVDGLGHAWSGGQAGGSFADPNGPDASAEMVRFFFEQDASGKGC